jgi:hypothetical protein
MKEIQGFAAAGKPEEAKQALDNLCEALRSMKPGEFPTFAEMAGMMQRMQAQNAKSKAYREETDKALPQGMAGNQP